MAPTLMGDLAAAVGLLTRLPIPLPVAGRDRAGAAWFPLVGAALGLVAGIAVAALGAVDAMLAAVTGTAITAVLTGALHLDGLADTADALLAPDATRAEAARRDPRAGPGGVVALLLVLAGQVAALAAVARAGEAMALIGSLAAIAGAARLVPVLATRLPGTRAAGGGFGAWFTQRTSGRDVMIAGALAILVAGAAALVAGTPSPVIVALATAVFGTAMARLLVRWRGGIDGDLLGASVELATLAGLVALAVVAAMAAGAGA